MTADQKGVLFGVSVGPGDPELLTLKAVRVISEADVVATPDTGRGPGTAYQIAERYLAGKELLSCATPMTRDVLAVAAARRATADAICQLLDQGKHVAYLCLGDIGVYSSYHYVQDLVVRRGYEAHIVPGVTSFCAAAARVGRPLCQGDEPLLVAPLATSDIDRLLDAQANLALVKSGKNLPRLRDGLDARGRLHQAVMVERCGLPDEHLSWGLAEAEHAGYLTVTLVGRPDVPRAEEGDALSHP